MICPHKSKRNPELKGIRVLKNVKFSKSPRIMISINLEKWSKKMIKIQLVTKRVKKLDI